MQGPAKAVVITIFSILIFIPVGAWGQTITSLSATSGFNGGTVVISGSNFGTTQGSSTVAFNGLTASVISWSDTSVSTIVPSLATTGNVVVTVAGTQSNGVNFTVLPLVMGATPSSGAIGSVIIISGTGFEPNQGAGTVTFNGTSAAINSWSATAVYAVVPNGATTGRVVLTTNAGLVSNGPTFTVVPPPVIASISPTSGGSGTTVAISGSNFGASQGVGTVILGGITVTVNSWSDTSISVTLPSTVITGNMVVTAAGGVASNGIAFTVQPTITSVSPNSGAVGSFIRIVGSNFGGSTGTVSFNGTNSTLITNWNPTSITATVPADATSGNVVVTSQGGTASNAVSFNVVPPPNITSITPGCGAVGSPVVIAGTNFGATSFHVTFFNGKSATIGTWSDTTITASVPTGATTGSVVVRAAGSVASAGVPFTVTSSPCIVDFNPKSAPAGTAITVTGNNLVLGTGGTTQVTLNQQGGGTIAAPISSATATSVSFVVPSGAASGPITVTTSGQSGVSAVPLTVVASSSFSLSAGPATATVLQGKSAAFTVSLSSTDGFSQLASLSVSGLPSGVTASFLPAQITAGHFSVLTVSAPAGQAVGTSPLTITASTTVDGISSTQSASVNLAVQALTTSLFGRIVESDTAETPLPGVTISFLGLDDAGHSTGCSGQTVADAGGNFAFASLGSSCLGRQLVAYNGNTAADLEKYASVNLAYTMVSGQATGPELVHLPRIDNGETIMVKQNARADQTITFTSMPGVVATIYAGTIFTLPDGSRPDPFPLTGVQVPVDRLPDTPVDGPGQLRAFIVAFQPADTTTNQPVSVSFPNTQNTATGVNMELDTLDPVVGALVKYGTGTVSKDAAEIVPDPDPAHPGHRFGISHFDWHGPLFPSGNALNPGPQGPKAGDPVDTASGLFILTKTDMIFGGARGGVAIERTYRTLANGAGPFGIGTRHNYGYQLVTAGLAFGNTVSLATPDGNSYTLTRQPDGSFTNSSIPSLRGATLTFATGQSGVQNYSLRLKDGTVFGFSELVTFNAFLTSITDANGNTITLTRNQTANASQITQITDAVGRSLLLAYDSLDRITSITDPIGRKVLYTYDAQGMLATVADPAGGVTKYAYDSLNRMTDITDARNILFLHNDYDANGKVSQQTAADGGVTKFTYAVLNPNASVSFTPAGGGATTTINTSPTLLTTVTDPRGNSTVYHFNAQSFLVDTTDAAGQKTIYSREPQTNLLLSVTDPLGRTTSYTYDSAGNVTSTTVLAGTPGALKTTFTYEPVRNKVTSITDPLDETSSLTYDTAGNLLSITDPLGHQTLLTYDAHGQLLTRRDALGNITQFGYANGSVASITDPLGNVAVQSADAAGRIISKTTAFGQTTTYSYGPVNEILQITDPVKGTISFSYDSNSNLLSATDPLGHSVTYTYDVMDRQLTRTDPLHRQESYQHDLSGNLVQVIDRRGKITQFQYDGLNRRVFAGFGMNGNAFDSTISYFYDSAGRLTRTVDSAFGTTTEKHDNLNRLVMEATPLGAVDYTFDPAGRRSSMMVSGQAPVVYSYDSAGRLTTITQATSNMSFVYDDVNRRSSMTLPNGIHVDYSYDRDSHLTGLTYRMGSTVLGDLSYGYDSLGRRTQVAGSLARTGMPQAMNSASYDAANELLNWNGLAISYDSNGNMLSDGANAFTWNARNQVASLNGSSLQYDAAGRRTRNATGTSFVYDGANATQEFSGSTVNANLLNGGVDEVFTRTDSSGSFATLKDVMGSTIALVDSSGNVQTSYTYDPYGNTAVSGVASRNEFQYTGRENEGNGLYYYRSRYYSPLFGRFISEDPLGFGGGDTNVYAYAFGNPISFVDPFGESGVLVLGAPIGAGIGADVIVGTGGAITVVGDAVIVVGEAAPLVGAAGTAGWLIGRGIGNLPTIGGGTVDQGWQDIFTDLFFPETAANWALARRPLCVRGAFPSPIPYPGNDPNSPPDGYIWKGKPGSVPGGRGNWHNPNTGESLNPDLAHPEPIGPHWDYIDPNANKWRIFPDGTASPKK